MYSLPSARRKKKKVSRIDLIPILDVVFVLIFFLLFSVQLIHVFEIGTDLPVFKLEQTQPKKDKKKFELKIFVDNSRIRFTNSKNQQLISSINVDWDDKDFLTKINEEVVKIKKENPEETRVVLTPKKDVNYQNLVKFMDQLRSKKTNPTKADKLFEQIIFEN